LFSVLIHDTLFEMRMYHFVIVGFSVVKRDPGQEKLGGEEV
jgi:hypothetical protein